MEKPSYLSETKKNSRIISVHLLYMWFYHALGVEKIMDIMLKPHIIKSDLGIENFDRDYISSLLEGIEKMQPKLIKEISKYLDKDWRFERLGKLPQIILLLATYELYYFKEMKKGIIISEYMLIAKKFSHGGETGFFNSILDKVWQ